jgi:DNA-binding LacI/PurR family transcriptional regulator
VTLVNADPSHGLPVVVADDYDGAVQCTNHLIKLGHRDITFVLSQQPDHFSIQLRQRGYSDAMKQAGLEQYVRVLTDPLEEIARSLKGAMKRPTAVVVYTHFTAVKLLQHLWDEGIRVPDDLSVATFSNAYPVEDCIPPLTTIALPTEEMGRAAATLLLEQINKGQDSEARVITLKEQLVGRRSTAPLSK